MFHNLHIFHAYFSFVKYFILHPLKLTLNSIMQKSYNSTTNYLQIIHVSLCSPLPSPSPLPPRPRPPPPPDVGPQLFGSDEEEVGLDSGVGDSDKVDDSEAAPADTNSYQVLELLKKRTLFICIHKICYPNLRIVFTLACGLRSVDLP